MSSVGIVVNGGVGNQMFKIFATISYYIDNCQNYVLYSAGENGYRKYYWDTLFSNISHKISTAIPTNMDNVNKYEAPYFHYKEIPVYGDDNGNGNDILLEGYYQSHKYFEKNINKIRRILGIDEHINNVLIKYPEYTTSKTISIHYRMGDYNNLQQWHPIQKPKYYIDAFKAMVERGVDIYDYEILYYCEANDNDVVDKYNMEINDALKEIYKKDLKYKKIADDIPDWKQMLIMTASKHYIIGNSTFSWFGAYLSSSIDPVICYPSAWFGPHYNGTITDDLFPDSWVKINDSGSICN